MRVKRLVVTEKHIHQLASSEPSQTDAQEQAKELMSGRANEQGGPVSSSAREGVGLRDVPSPLLWPLTLPRFLSWHAASPGRGVCTPAAWLCDDSSARRTLPVLSTAVLSRRQNGGARHTAGAQEMCRTVSPPHPGDVEVLTLVRTCDHISLPMTKGRSLGRALVQYGCVLTKRGNLETSRDRGMMMLRDRKDAVRKPGNTGDYQRPGARSETDPPAQSGATLPPCSAGSGGCW